MHRDPPDHRAAAHVEAVIEALRQRLDRTPVGDPSVEGVRMGSLVGRDQVEDVWRPLINWLKTVKSSTAGNVNLMSSAQTVTRAHFSLPPCCIVIKPFATDSAHSVEAFGPVTHDHALSRMRMKPLNWPGWDVAAWWAHWSLQTMTKRPGSCLAQPHGMAACWC